MSASSVTTSGAAAARPSAAVPPPRPRAFNWADASDTEDDCNTTGANSTAIRSPIANTNHHAASSSAADSSSSQLGCGQQQKCFASIIPMTPPAATVADVVPRTSTPPRQVPIRQMGAGSAANSPSIRLSQEVTINAAIPYKLKSVWNGDAQQQSQQQRLQANASFCAGAVADASAASVTSVSNNTTNGNTAATNTPSMNSISSTTAASSASPHYLLPAAAATTAVNILALPTKTNPNNAAAIAQHHSNALDDLIRVLNANGGQLTYQDLMQLSSWRSAHYRRCHSLFSFVKGYRDIFVLDKDTVTLVAEGRVVSELLKVGGCCWATAAAAPTASSSPLPAVGV